MKDIFYKFSLNLKNIYKQEQNFFKTVSYKNRKTNVKIYYYMCRGTYTQHTVRKRNFYFFSERKHLNCFVKI